jgi:hypothetical protein
VRYRAFVLAALLIILPACLITYRIFSLGYPPLPAAPEKAWQLSMDAGVRSGGEEVKVVIGLPHTYKDRVVFEEKITGGELDFSLLHEGPNRFGVWSGMADARGESLSYRATIVLRPEQKVKEAEPAPGPYPETIGKAERELVERLALNWRTLSLQKRFHAVVSAATGHWGAPHPPGDDILAWTRLREERGHPAALMALLRAAGLPARIVEGLALTESVTPKPVTWTEVWTGSGWERLHPETGEVYRKSALLLPLTTGAIPAIRVSNGELTGMRWTLRKQIIGQWRLQFERIRQSERFLDRWSLFRLPEEFQATFRILLLVPIGAFIVCVLRNIVGFPTFGIFMPVLMALAFRNTGLAYGLGIFGGVVFIGYAVRRFLDRLHLLLVPRLSVILTLVIACFTVFAVVGNKLGMRQFMAVGLLPFVILTMTIERFFVIMEEEGLREGLRTALGSAVVAGITYEIIHVEPLQLSFFIYPELLCVVAALQVLIGRYTGYRLSEFLRFRKLRSS